MMFVGSYKPAPVITGLFKYLKNNKTRFHISLDCVFNDYQLHKIPMDVVGDQGNIEHECEPLSSKEKHQIEEYMDEIFR